MKSCSLPSVASRARSRLLSGCVAALLLGASPLFALVPPGATPAPNLPDTTSPFPKRMQARGATFGVWDQATLLPHLGRSGFYSAPSVSASDENTFSGLLEFDQAGNTLRRISPLQHGTTLAPTTDPAVFFAERSLFGTSSVSFGRFSSTAPFAAVYQHTLAADPAKTTVYQGLSDGRVAVVQNLNDHIEVIVLQSNGAVAWARRLNSALFGVTAGPVPVNSQTATATPLTDGSLLIHVNKLMLDLETLSLSAENIFVKLSATGVQEWARKSSGVDRVSLVIPGQNNTLYFVGTDLSGFGGGDDEEPAPSTQVISKFTPAGVPVWSKRYTGSLLSVAGELPGDKLLLSGYTRGLTEVFGSSVLAVVGSTGAIDAQTMFSFGAQNFTFPAIENGRIWLATVATDASGGVFSSAGPAHVGLTDASLGTIQWKRYKHDASFAMISPDPESDDVAVSFQIPSEHASDVLTIKDNFTVNNAVCALLTDTTTPASSPGLVVENAAVTLTDVAVGSVAFTPTLTGAALTFEVMTTSETPLCNAGGGGGTVTFLTQPQSQTVAASGAATFSATVTAPAGAAVTYQWRLNGVAIAGATGATYTVASVQPGHVGLYTVAATANGTTVVSGAALLSLTTNAKIVGAATEVGSNIRHPNGNTYDQFLLTGSSASVRADPGEVARISYIDLNDDIVQVEFAGAGVLTVTLANPSGPALAAHYNQPTVAYMKGHATLTFTGTDQTSNLSVFSVGSITAVNQALFKPGIAYDGIADVALITIASPNQTFGGIRAGNTACFAVSGDTGISARGVTFTGPVVLHDIDARDAATPRLLTGTVAGSEIRITGGNLLQSNTRAIEFGTATVVRMSAGTTSHGVPLAAQLNQGKLERDGQNVTTAVVVNP
ncbi:MAG: hypothetical protein U1F61_18535 [Opitutaceae bacterium]